MTFLPCHETLPQRGRAGSINRHGAWRRNVIFADVSLAVRLLGDQCEKSHMDQQNFRDDLFDNATGDWVQSHLDEHFRQSYLREEGPIYCETLMTVHGTTDADAAIALICGPWDWWEHGRITDFTTN
jgi:hypothetical protein